MAGCRTRMRADGVKPQQNSQKQPTEIEVKSRPVHLVLAAVLSVAGSSAVSARVIQFNTPFFCNGEREIVFSCRDDSDTSYCMVMYPDRTLQGGSTVQKAELRGDVIKRIKSCVNSRSTLASVPSLEQSPARPASAPGAFASSGSIFNSLFGWLIIGGFCYLVYRLLFKKGARVRNPAMLKSNAQALAAFGNTPEERTARIDATFDQRQADVELRYKDKLASMHVGRSLSAMPMRELESLRTVLHLFNLGLQEYNNFFLARFGLIWAGGKASRYQWQVPDRYIEQWTNADQAVNIALQDLNGALRRNPDHPVLTKLQSRLVGDGGDLLPGAPLKCSDSGPPAGNGLILGLDPKQRTKRWYYDGEGSLITVAPTRSGKTEGQVYPNVLNWQGPMVILDIKGEIYAKTSKWRRQNVGPVYRFSPLDAGRTDCYNPLTAVRADPLHLWSDAGTLADLMIVPGESGGGGNSKFFDDAARDLVQAAIAYVCVEPDPAKRPMSKLLDIVHGVDWNDFVSYLQARVDMPTLARAGKALAQPLPAETRATILRTAQGKLSAWMGDLVERATARSDWQPLDFRSGSNPTLYICINFGDMEGMRSVLRTIIGQHINLLTNGEPPARTQPPAPPILFMLDEMPQLKNMPPIANALVVGAGYGVKLWMFVQDVGQLKKEYPNAEGMMGNCAVRMYMNPDLADGTAQKLSDDIGFRESIVDGSRVKIVEPNVLAGEQFKDKVIVWARGMARPASLQKNFAYLDEALTARMGGL
jgi:type IV secretion system protein VirD4